MDAHKTKLASLFSGDEVRYVIPVYQRNYNWSNKQCRQLFHDVCSIIGNDKEHFFGSVVLFGNHHDVWSIIDGQQRLTTVSLMWLAMSKLISEHKKDANEYLAQNIRNKYCFCSVDDGTLLPRIEHVEKDRKAYVALIEGNDEHFIQDSNITRNFYLFHDWIEHSEYSLSDFDNALKRLMMVKIDLDVEDNPQLIFESLNSTGLALSDGDKIRNFILMNLKVKEQKEYYKNYWRDIETYSNYTGDSKNALNAVTLFVRDYITAKTTHIPSMNSVYDKFKEYANGKETKSLLADMKTYSRYLYEIERAKTMQPAINRVFQRLALLEMTVTHPFEFNLMHDFNNGLLNEKEVIKTLELIENFIFRRLICEVPTNALNKIFATLYSSAKKIVEKQGIDFYDAVVYILLSRSDSSRFPDDTEFKEALAVKNIYKMRPKNKIYIFYRFNAGSNVEGDTSVINKMQKKDTEGNAVLSVEHIMPQTLTKDWVEALGGEKKAKGIQERWEHTIANLTLTGYNSLYSNNTFQQKLSLKDENGLGVGFKDSPLHINEYIKTQTEWGETQLEERLRLLQNEAVNVIWPMPQQTYFPTEKQFEELSLDDENSDFTYSDFIDGTVDGNRIPLKAHTPWKQVFIEILKMLNADYHRELVQIANNKDQVMLQNEGSKLSTSTLLFDNIYATLNTSTSKKMELLKSIITELGIDNDKVEFHVNKEQTEIQVDE